MDKRTQHSHCKLPNTPRVSGKVLEYYQKFGQERDLEKFMRLYSPASSQESEKTQDGYSSSTKSCRKLQKSGEVISSTNSCEALATLPSRPLSVYAETNSKSLPNIDIQGHTEVETRDSPSNGAIVDINIEAESEKGKILQTLSISTDNMKTPKKTFKSAKTQTPESVAKTHRRLEWDSLGDVGYKKSMSTSNISIMERSLLKEFFKEKSAVSEPSPTVRSGVNQHKTNENKIAQNFKADEIEHSTPPLACSTLFPIENRSKPKMMSQSTSSTSLNEKFEKYAQTSIIKLPTVRSQEIQCTLSSSNSIVEGTATPSSFEYYSSKSSKSRSSKSSDNMLTTNARHEVKPQEHPFIASITDLLMKRRASGEKSQQKRHRLNNIKDLQIKFQAALDENKENQSNSAVDFSLASSFSLSKQAPELDLGIQLICSLIDAKSLNGKHKKQLIRDIIKRLTRIEGDDKTYNSTTTNSSEGITDSSRNCDQNKIFKSVINKSNEQNQTKSLELGVSPLLVQQMNRKKKSTVSSANTIGSYDGVLGFEQHKNKDNSRSQSFPEFHQQIESINNKQFPAKSKLNECTQNSIDVSNAAPPKIDKETQSESIRMEEAVKNQKAEVLQTKFLKTNRCTQTSKTSLTHSTSATSTSDLITQKVITKPNKDMNSSDTEADQPTMREWLNPLTQSEIEYDKKKQLEMKKKAAAQQEKLRKSKHDCGRVQQLNWIETEINRLECLKHLLLKDESSTSVSSCATSLNKNSTKDSKQTEKQYDTVYTDKSSVLSESAEQLVQEIEIILEESNEDVLNVKDNIKHTKNRKKEIQIMYEKEHDTLKKTQGKPKLLDENINIHEEQHFKHITPSEDYNKPNKQREKIATPSTDTSKETESLKELVRQRKREFMEAYKAKKHSTTYDALKQQQKDFKYLNLPQKSVTTTDSEHYSIPHTLPRKYIPKDIIYYKQHSLPKVPTEKDDANERKNQHQSTKPLHKETIRVTAANTSSYTTTSTSSMLCVTSDISVPMGSQNSSSSPLSTHHYNKAPTTIKTGVAIQTSDSIRFSKPIYGPTNIHSTVISSNPILSSTTACIQVKPKGIAYVIEFDDDNKNIKKSAADVDVNSNHLNPFSEIRTTNSRSSSTNEAFLTLQEHLEKKKPKFLEHSKERKAILNKLQSMRQERARQLREIIENTSINSLDRRLQYLPPPPIQKARILRTKEMKALTNKRVANLPEVLAKQEREKEERKRRTNRVLRDIFNKRLQKRVRSGQLSLNHSKNVV